MITTHLLHPEEVILEEVERPKPKEHEVLIKVHNIGICGSDIHAYYGRHPYISLPIIQGHEFSGEISELGSGVGGISIGDRVTAVPMLHCRQCPNCLRGEYNRCSELRFIGCQATGAMAEYVVVHEDKIVLLPEEIDDEAGALIEPLAVGIHGIAVGGLQEGQNVIIMGAGTIGLMTLLASRAIGARIILQTDILQNRLSLAKELGADRVYLEDGKKQNYSLENVDIIFECVGAAETIQDAIQYAPRGCRIVIIGVFSKNIPVNIGYIQDHELEVRGVAGYTIRDFETAIRLIVEKKIKLDQLKKVITNRFPLHQIKDAYKHLEQNLHSTLKVMLEVKN